MNPNSSNRRFEWIIWISIIVITLIQRFIHLGPFIEDPHSWRQSDTAFYIWDFYQNGINLFKPSVCWMGSSPHVILEFPLYEAIAAIGYHLFGPHHEIVRILSLLFFGMSAWYLFKLIHLQAGKRLALITVCIYLSMALGLYYSRALHIDFSALAFALAGWFYVNLHLQKPSWKRISLSILFFSLSFLTKAPYAYYLALPISIQIFQQKKWKSFLKLLPFFFIPVLLFILWRSHVAEINASAPDWNFLPGYQKLIHMESWYFGDWEQRKDSYIWSHLWERSLGNMIQWLGLPFLILGIISFRYNKKPVLQWQAWLIGLIAYLLLFFNLNFRHDYYQIPFMPLIAVFIALGVERANSFLSRWSENGGKILSISLLTILCYMHIRYAEENYYQRDILMIEAGKVIQKHSPPDAILIYSAPGVGIRNPNGLYRARRMGWPIYPENLSIPLIKRLETEGASYLVWLGSQLPDDSLGIFLNNFPHKNHKIPLSEKDSVYIFNLVP